MMRTVDTREIATVNEILRGVVGSTAHGTAIDGQDDRDEMGVFVEPPENVCGLTLCEHYIHRDKPEGVRSGPGAPGCHAPPMTMGRFIVRPD